MYKVASDKRQSALYRGRPSDWINGEERLSAEDKLKQLQQGWKILQRRILALPNGSEERRKLGRELQSIQDQITLLKADFPKSQPDLRAHFMNEARRILSPGQFEMVLNAARIETAREQARRDAADLLQGSEAAGSLHTRQEGGVDE
jgi:hypothetical protein